MKSSYAQYLDELSDRKMYEDEKGFFIYRVTDTEFYVQEVFVKKEYRRKGITQEYFNKVKELAKEHECTYLLGSICTMTNGIKAVNSKS